MSASSKKKLRNEQVAEKMTQRQLAEQKEAKKLKTYTILFCTVLAVLLIIAVSVLSYRAVTGSGLMERSTTAATLGEHKISNAELNYYYIDAVNNFNSQYGSYAAYMGLDTTLPLDQQVQDPTTGATWADYFLDTALSNAASIYAVEAAAKEAGYSLSEAEKTAIEEQLTTHSMYAELYGYSDLTGYLKAMYGNGANEKTYRAYLERSTLAQSYYSHYGESLNYDDATLRAAEADKLAEYSNYTYNYYLIDVEDYLQGGTTADDGTVTYSDEEQNAAKAAAEADAVALTDASITDVQAFDTALASLPSNESGAASTLCDDIAYASVLSQLQSWVTDQSRVAGNRTYIPNERTTTAEDGTETTTVTGYFVVYFVARNDNNFPLANVRHILISYEGGTYDESTYTTTYSDEEKAAAEEKAQALLDEWYNGDITEESFAALANQHSADSDGTDGGLYTDVYPGQMVAAFEEWCFDSRRAPGNTGLVHTPYGCHIMFYVGDSDLLYRDYLIREELRAADLEAWYNALVAATPVVKANTKYVPTDLVLGTSY